MTVRTFDRWLNRTLHVAGGMAFLCLASFMSYTAGDWRWPYVVQSIDVVNDRVQRGSTLTVISVRTYLDDCDLFFERQIESVAQPTEPPTILPEERTATPWRYNGRGQGIHIAIPPDFPCGAAQIRTKPAAACNWVQRHIWRQRSRDALTPFEVGCDEAR